MDLFGYIYQTYVTEVQDVQIEKNVTDITLDQEEIYMQVGDIFQINAYVKPDDANDKLVIFQSTRSAGKRNNYCKRYRRS